jgi:molybdate transport system substrate-binding protein
MSRRLLIFIGLAIAAFLVVVGIRFAIPSFAVSQSKTSLSVSAAASLQSALEEIQPLYQKTKSNHEIRYNFGSSGALLQQIQQGAPADIFISAGKKQIDALEQQGQLVAGTRSNLAGNRLVLITPKNGPAITALNQLMNSNVKRISIGEPRSVPAGQYAEQTLRKVGIYDQVKSKFVLANNVRQVLAAVESGNADAGFVYVTDAKISDKVNTALTVDEKDHAAIVYPMAVIQRGKNTEAAKEFMQFLTSPEAQMILRKNGFTVSP